MSKIILTGVRDLKTDEQIDDQTDYGIFLIASLYETGTPAKCLESEEVKYKLKVINIESIINLKDKKAVEFHHGKSPSQKLRWLVEQNLGREEYENFIGYLMSRTGELCDDYREAIDKKIIIK